MGLVTLVSGGLDSTLISVLAKEENITQYPLFIDYGQKARHKEWQVCQQIHAALELPTPTRMDISCFGSIIKSGLTDKNLDIKSDAYTPGRNLIFLVMASAYAYQMKVSSISIGLLSEQFCIFPDQTDAFLLNAEKTISSALGYKINILVPLRNFSKQDVIKLAKLKNINNTYSCHSGNDTPCGKCISCLEFMG